ncbi:MAG: prepilin peptidase [Planctomycetota bacterium]
MSVKDLDPVLLGFSAAFGAIVGSFLNAAIHRIPRNISLVKRSRSFCPKCQATIAWYDNIPILSYLLLLGRCRHCRKRISPRYLVVEVLTAGLFAALYWHVRFLNGPGTGPGGKPLLHPVVLVVYMPLVAALILVAFVDLQDYEETEEEKAERAKLAKKLAKEGKDIEAEDGPAVYGIIPNEVTKPGLFAALPLAFLLPQVHWNAVQILAGWPRVNAVFDAAIGALVGGGLTWATGVLGKVVFRKEAMGGGDVKLMGMIGGLLGWKAAVLVFFLAPVFGAIFGVVMLLMRGDHYVRYGPFLAAAAVLIIFYEPAGSMYFEIFSRMPLGDFVPHHNVPFWTPAGPGFGP